MARTAICIQYHALTTVDAMSLSVRLGEPSPAAHASSSCGATSLRTNSRRAAAPGPLAAARSADVIQMAKRSFCDHCARGYPRPVEEYSPCLHCVRGMHWPFDAFLSVGHATH